MPSMKCYSPSAFKQQAESLRPNLFLAETEDSWNTIAKSIIGLQSLCEDGGCEFPEEVLSVMRSSSRPLNSALESERTRLSGAAIDLISVVASGLGTSFSPLLALYFPTLLTLCGRTNKVVLTRARSCIITIIETTQLPSVFPFLLHSVKDKSSSLRLTVAEGALTCMNCLNPPDLEKESRIRDIETLIRATARDTNVDIRKVSRKIFDAYKLLFPNRVETFTAPLSPTMKKYLDISSKKTVAASNPLPRSMSSAKLHPLPAPPALRAVSAPSVPVASTSNSTSSTRVASMPPPPQPMHRVERPTRTAPPPKEDQVLQEYVLMRPSKPGHVMSFSRSTSALNERQRTASSSSAPPQRPLASSSSSVPSTHAPTEPALVIMPKRVPLPTRDEEIEQPKRPQLTNSGSSRPGSSTSTRRPGPELPQLSNSGSSRPGSSNSNRRPGPELPKLVQKPSLRQAMTIRDKTSTSRSNSTREVPKVAGAPPAPRTKANMDPPPPRQRAAEMTKAAAAKTKRPPPPVKAASTRDLKLKSARPVTPVVAKAPSFNALQADPVVPSSQGAQEAAVAPEPAQGTPEAAQQQPLDEHDSKEAEVPQPTEPEPAVTAVTVEDPPTEQDLSTHGIQICVSPTSPPSQNSNTAQDPTTPRASTAKADIMSSAARTPITSLLLSIQEGFAFTPGFSPPESYFPLQPITRDLVIPFPLQTGRSSGAESVNLEEEQVIGGGDSKGGLGSSKALGADFPAEEGRRRNALDDMEMNW